MTDLRPAPDEYADARGHAVAGAGERASPTRASTRLVTALTAEPRWLRGVTWPLVGMVLLIAVVQNTPQVARALVPDHVDGAESWAFVLFDLATQVIVGLSILLIASALANLARPRVPVPLALALAVLAGTFIPFNIITVTFLDGVATLVQANMQARRVAVPWGIAAVAWFFLDRANVREAALRATEIARRRLESGLLEARLQAMQAQVEPHFLFNTLAHVRRLYRTDPVRARLMLDSFRAYLRSALPQMRHGATTLGREVDLARAYLDVQQVRMGRRLAVIVDVPERVREHPFPPMMLLSLVENAIKHGLNPLPQGGAITISAAERDHALEVRVVDTGHGIGEKMGNGVGLANVRDRLAALHGTAGGLTLAANSPSGVCATIRVPAAGASRDATADAPVEVAA